MTKSDSWLALKILVLGPTYQSKKIMHKSGYLYFKTVKGSGIAADFNASSASLMTIHKIEKRHSWADELVFILLARGATLNNSSSEFLFSLLNLCIDTSKFGILTSLAYIFCFISFSS